LGKFFFAESNLLQWNDALVSKTRTSIILFVWDHTTYPAAWVVDITGIAGDEMDMAVHHALAGDRADVCADVVAVRCMLFVDKFFARIGHFEKGISFLICQVKAIPHVGIVEFEQAKQFIISRLYTQRSGQSFEV